jgi:hypothetical protein
MKTTITWSNDRQPDVRIGQLKMEYKNKKLALSILFPWRVELFFLFVYILSGV